GSRPVQACVRPRLEAARLSWPQAVPVCRAEALWCTLRRGRAVAWERSDASSIFVRGRGVTRCSRKVRAQPFAYYLASRAMGTLRQGEEGRRGGCDCRKGRAGHARLQESPRGSRPIAGIGGRVTNERPARR